MEKYSSRLQLMDLIMVITMVRNEGGKGKGKGQGEERNSCSSKTAGMTITAAEATTIHCF